MRRNNRMVHPRSLHQLMVLKDVLLLRAFKEHYRSGFFGWPFFKRLELLVLGWTDTSYPGHTLIEFSGKGWVALVNRGVSRNLRVWELTQKGLDFLHETRRWELPSLGQLNRKWEDMQERIASKGGPPVPLEGCAVLQGLFDLARHAQAGYDSKNGWITPDGTFLPCGFGQHILTVYEHLHPERNRPNMTLKEGEWAEEQGWFKLLKWRTHEKQRLYCKKLTEAQRRTYAVWEAFNPQPTSLTSSMPGWEVFMEDK